MQMNIFSFMILIINTWWFSIAHGSKYFAAEYLKKKIGSGSASMLHFQNVFHQLNMAVVFHSFIPGKIGGQESFESVESLEACESLTQSWGSHSHFCSLQRVPSYNSFDSDDYPATLRGHPAKGTFKDYVKARMGPTKDKSVILAAALAGYTGVCLCNPRMHNNC